MTYEQNSNYVPTERMDSESYWTSHLLFRSGTQDLTRLEPGIRYSLRTNRLPDNLHGTGVVLTKSNDQLEVTAILEADTAEEAVEIASGVILVAMERAGVELEELILADGNLVSGQQLQDDQLLNPAAASRDAAYELDTAMYQLFTRLHTELTAPTQPV